MRDLVIRLAFLLCIVPALAPGGTARSSVLVVYDADDAYALPCFEQTIVTLEYNRIPYVTYNLASTTSLPPLGDFMSVITVTEMLWKLDAAACGELKSYVRSGGGVAVLYRGWNPNLREMLGIENTAPPAVTEKKGKGLRMVKEIIPGITGAVVSESILADISAYDIRTTPGVSVFATTDVDELPAAWVNTFGGGRVVFWNCTILSEKIYRGLIIPSLGAVQPATVSLIMNLGVICLDDFPNASPNVKVEPIKSEFDMTVSEFYAFRWFPDMMTLARQYGLHYTSALIFSYSEITTPPYTTKEWAQSALVRAGKQINSSIWLTHEAQRDIDVGYHGQNHQPLTLSNWRTVDNMKLALTSSQRRWQYDNLGPAPVSYIPPMNVIDSSGMRALTDVFPTIRVVGSQYMGKYELGQNREFGIDPWNAHITSIPRVTSGFLYDDFNRVLTLSELNAVGAWTHFVHPDDIIPTSGRYAENTREDLQAENIGWLGGSKRNGLFYQFQKWVGFVHRYYPWLRYRDYAHSSGIVQAFASTSAVVKATGRTLTLRYSTAPNYAVLHLTANAVVSCTGGEIVHTTPLAYSTYYVVHARSHDVVLTLRDSIPTMLYRAGAPDDLYLAGNSRYSSSPTGQTRYPSGLAALPAAHGPATRSAAAAARNENAAAVQTEKAAAVDIDTYTARVRTDPEDVTAWMRLRDLQTVRGSAPAVLQADEHISKLLPNDTSKTKTLARDYVAMDEKEKAIPIYKSVVKRYPYDAQSWYHLYELYAWSERPADAASALSDYVRYRPSDDDALQKLAELDVATEKQLEAIPLYETLIERHPARREFREMLAQLYTWNSMHVKAAKQYERLHDMTPSDSASVQKAVNEYMAANETTEAALVLEHIIAQDPDDLERRRELIALCRATGNNRGAITQSEELLKRSPSDITALKQLGEMLVWEDRQPEAIGIYERIVKAEPDSLPSRIMLARLYAWNKHPHEALAESKRVLRRDRSNLDALKIVAESDRADDNWFDARAWYTLIRAREPANKDARDYLAEVRRNHGLQFTSSYEWIDDSNELRREELPVSVELLQTHTADYFLHLRREYVRDDRAHLSALGYGAGLGSRFRLGKKTSLTIEALATQYDSNYVPITAGITLEHTFGERVSAAMKLERTETVEGIRAIRNRIYTTSARGEMYVQATTRWSVSGLAEFESYTDNNLRSTGELLTTYKIVMNQPQITFQASSVYQDTKFIYPTSEPYWTPARLFTTTAGLTMSYTFFTWFTPEVTEGGTLQGTVFSNTFSAKATLQLSQFLQLVIDYGRIGSTVYNQNVAHAALNFRY